MNIKKIILLWGVIAVCLFTWSQLYCRNFQREFHEYTENLEPSEDRFLSSETSEIFEINSEQDWITFADRVNSGDSMLGVEVQLKTDLDFSKVEYWKEVPIGDGHERAVIEGQVYEANAFSGVFQGNNHVIENFHLRNDENSGTEQYGGLFGQVTYYSEIKNLHLKNCSITGYYGAAGGICAYATQSVKITNCSYEGNIDLSYEETIDLYGTAAVAGGIAAYIENTCIDSCSTDGSIKALYAGGIAGSSIDSGESVITKCVNRMSMADESRSSDSKSAGILLFTDCFEGYGCVISNCANYGSGFSSGIVRDVAARLRCCFNFADAETGLVRISERMKNVDYQESAEPEIMYCVNLGQTTASPTFNVMQYGSSIKNCLYTAGDGSETFQWSSENSIVKNLVRIKADEKMREETDRYIQNGQYERAFEYLLQNHLEGRRKTAILFSIIAAAVLLMCYVIATGISTIRKKNKYAQAFDLMQKEEYYKAFLMYQSFSDGDTSRKHAQDALQKYIAQWKRSECILLGHTEEQEIEWVYMDEDEETISLLGKYAIEGSAVHSENTVIKWTDTDLCRKLNAEYKNKYFLPLEQEQIEEISILTVKEAETLFHTGIERQCQWKKVIPGVLSNKNNVYWWLRKSGDAEGNRMPFVTPDGLINVSGRRITDANFAVRLVVRLRK